MVEHPEWITNNIPVPYPKNTKEVKNEPNPEQFKRAMKKVGKSDESEQKGRSPSKNKQTQGRDDKKQRLDDGAGPTPPHPSAPFSEYMRGDSEQRSIFDSESAGIQVSTPSQQGSPLTTPPPNSVLRGNGTNYDREPAAPPPSSEEGSGDGSPTTTSPSTQSSSSEYSHDVGEPSHSQQPTPPPQETSCQEQEQPVEGNRSDPSEAPHSQREKEGDSPPSSTDQTTTQKKTASKRQKLTADSSLLSSQPTRGALTKEKPHKKRAAPKKKLISTKSKMGAVEGKSEKKGVASTASKEKQCTKKASPAATQRRGSKKTSSTAEGKSSPPTKRRSPSTPREETTKRGRPSKLATTKKVAATRPRLKKQAAIEGSGGAMPPVAARGGSSADKGSNKNRGKPSEGCQAATTAPLPEGLLPPTLPLDSEPMYLRLPQDLFELVEKIGGTLMILHQQNSGITQTTVTLNIPNSILDGTQVLIEEYSTAPKSFNIQLVGNPEAMELFNSHMSQLNNAFQQANYDFEVRLLNPILTERKRSHHMIRRKSAAGKDSGEGQGKNR